MECDHSSFEEQLARVLGNNCRRTGGIRRHWGFRSARPISLPRAGASRLALGGAPAPGHLWPTLSGKEQGNAMRHAALAKRPARRRVLLTRLRFTAISNPQRPD